MSKFKVQSLTEADITRLEKASTKGADAAKEIRGFRKELSEAADLLDSDLPEAQELVEIYAETDGNLFAVYQQETGKPGKSEDDIAKKVRSKAKAKEAAAKRAAEKGVGSKARAKAKARSTATASAQKPVAKPSKSAGPLRGNAKKAAEMRQKREAMLASTLSRKDLQELSSEQVLAIARQFNDLRMNVRKDQSTASKQRVDATPANLIRWMRSPGSFDLIGIDSARATAPTANLKITVGEWFKRYTGG